MRCYSKLAMTFYSIVSTIHHFLNQFNNHKIYFMVQLFPLYASFRLSKLFHPENSLNSLFMHSQKSCWRDIFKPPFVKNREQWQFSNETNKRKGSQFECLHFFLGMNVHEFFCFQPHINLCNIIYIIILRIDDCKLFINRRGFAQFR